MEYERIYLLDSVHILASNRSPSNANQRRVPPVAATDNPSGNVRVSGSGNTLSYSAAWIASSSLFLPTQHFVPFFVGIHPTIFVSQTESSDQLLAGSLEPSPSHCTNQGGF